MKIAFLKNVKLNKTWAALGAALVIGLLAALAARSYLSDQMAAIEARSKTGQVNLVVAAHDMRKGERLTAENVAVRPIPADYAHSGAVQPGDFDRVEGQAIAYPVKSGEMILWSLVEGKKAPTFSTRVEAGMRAITVPVDEINSISGMLEPGDMIDLIVTLDQKDKRLTFPLLQRVQIIATGQRSVDDPKSGERREYSTVTLETTPEQAQNVVVAREAGKITALLRNPQDTQMVVSSVDVAALLGHKGELAAIVADDRQVPVLYGGRSGKLPPEGLMLNSARAAGAANTQRPLAPATAANPAHFAQPDSANASSPAMAPVVTNTADKQL